MAKSAAVAVTSWQQPLLRVGDRASVRAARLRYDRSVKTGRLVIVFGLFFALLAAAVLVGGRTFVDPLLQAAAAKREANSVGEVVLTMSDPSFCRHMSFDNATGEIARNSVEHCAQIPANGPKRAVNGFSWGAR